MRWAWKALGLSLILSVCVRGAAPAAAGVIATVVLKGGAAITGRVIETRRDLVVIDVGYTVIVVPAAAVLRLEPATAKSASAASRKSGGKETTAPETGSAALPPRLDSATGVAKGLYSTATAPLAERSVRELAALQGEAVVQVRTPGGLGSGYIITEDGYLVTNFHVIEAETQISVEVYHLREGQLEQKLYKDVRIVAINKFGDAALLKIEDKGAPKFKRVLLGESEALAVGDRVFAIGSPLGLERTVTEGIISTKTRQMAGSLYLQTTAQINPGNSGGPLFNMRGEVIGMINMKVNFGEGLGFAIPIEAVRWFLDHRDAFAYENDNPSNPYRYLEPPNRTKSSETLNNK